MAHPVSYSYSVKHFSILFLNQNLHFLIYWIYLLDTFFGDNGFISSKGFAQFFMHILNLRLRKRHFPNFLLIVILLKHWHFYLTIYQEVYLYLSDPLLTALTPYFLTLKFLLAGIKFNNLIIGIIFFFQHCQQWRQKIFCVFSIFF